MRTGVGLEGMESANRAIAEDLRKRQKRAISVAGEQLKSELREMTRRALGDRLAKTWRLNTYGMDGSEDPAAWIYSKAPDIIQGNMRGGTIVPVAGTRFLAIPTANVPQRRGRGAKAKMSPEEVEAHFNDDLVLVRGKKPGTLLGYMNLIQALSTRRPGLRPKTKGRLRQGRKVKMVLMFTFVKSVRQRKMIDPDAAFARARRTARRLLEEG